jgi:hypothetical protein
MMQLLAVLVACGPASPPAEPPPSAQAAVAPAEPPAPGSAMAACAAFVDHSNGLPCLPMKLDRGRMCGLQLDRGACDLAPYFDCLRTNTKCAGDIPDVSGQSACDALACGQ